MLIKHLHHGSGSGRKAANYLLQDKDAKGQIRAEVTVLRGDPHLVASVADSLSFVHGYCSGVIAFSPEDQPTENQIDAVLNHYTDLSFAGLDPENYCFSAVLHREANGGVHIHTFSAKVDLATGKSFNPAPPGHQFEFDQIVHHHNWLHGWSRPDDQDRARTCSKGHLHYRDAKTLKQMLDVEPDTKQVLTDYLVEQILLGKVKNRADVRTCLADIGEITRENANSISVKLKGYDRAFRLKGTIYEQSFNGTIEEETGRGQEASRGINIKKSANALGKFSECCRKRAEFNRKKYRPAGGRDPQQSEVDQRRSEGSEGADRQLVETDTQAISVGAGNDPLDLDDYLRGQLGSDAILVDRDLDQGERPGKTLQLDRSGGSREKSNMATEKTEGFSSGKRLLGSRNSIKGKHNDLGQNRKRRTQNIRQGKRAGHSLQGLSTKRLAYNSKQETQGILSVDVELDRRAATGLRWPLHHRGVVDHDGIGNAAIEAIERSERANSELDSASASLDRYSRELAATANRCLSGVRKVMTHSADELSRFKSEINLSAYLADQGYQLDRKKSCTSYAVMRKGEEKLVITRAVDGHYVYTDAHNERDCGSIIDFVQHRRSLNLGQVRKELRPWIGTDRRPGTVERYQAKIEKSPADYVRIATSWSNAGEVKDFDYLRSRGIDRNTVDAYSDRIKQSSSGTLMFSHLDPHSPVSGYEFKAQDYAGFSKDGRKGLFIARRSEPQYVKRLVVTETALDALSYAQLESCRKDTAYISTGGNPSDEQIEQLRRAVMLRNPDEVVLAHDNDKGGDEQAEKLRSRLQDLCSRGEIERRAPQGAKDWNQELQDLAKQNSDSPGPRRR